MAWKLVFRGKLANGVTPDQAAERLAEMFHQGAETVRQRLFLDRSVRVKTVETESEARRFAAVFAKAGVELDVEPLGEQSPPSPTIPRETVTRPKRRYGLLGAGVAVLAVVAAGAWYAWPVVRNGATSVDQVAASRALATSSMIALGHLDIERAMELQERLLGAPDPDALLTDEEGLWQSLLRAGIDPGERIDDVLGGVYTDGEGASWAVVVLGRIPVERLRGWIEARFDVESFEASTGTVFFTWIDEETCEPSPLHAARISESSVVLAAADEIEALQRRLEAPAAAERAIDEWLVRTEEHVLTLGIFNPTSIGRTAEGLAGMVLGQAGHAVRLADAVYLGVAPALMPPGVVVSGALESADAQFLSTAHETASTWLTSAKASAEQNDPDLADIYDRIDVSLDGHSLSAGVRLDTNLDDELRRLVRATLQRAFQVRIGPPGGSNAATGEKIDEDPARFANASVAQLEVYDAFGSGFFEPQWQRGPFAAAVSKLERSREGRLEVSLRAEGRGLPNLGERSELVRWRVTDVIDGRGESLMPARECGPVRGREWTAATQVTEGSYFADGELVRFPKVALEKSVILAEGARAGDVAAIRGELEFRLPSEVRSIRLDAPLAGKVVERDDLRVRFEPASERSISYQASGDTARLLSVRALNAAGEVLEKGGSTRGENWLRAGEYASIQIHGAPASVEVIVAETFEPLRYGFELPGAYPPIGTAPARARPAATFATPEALARALALGSPEVAFDHAEPAAVTTAGPALVVVQRIQASALTGLFAQMEIYVPQAMPLRGQLNGVSIVLDRVELANGEVVGLDLAAPVALRSEGAYWLNGEYTPNPDKPWLKGSATVQAAEYDGPRPAIVHGRVVFRSVADPIEATMSAALGSRWNEDGAEISVDQWRENELRVRIPAGAERIVSLVALDASGKAVGRADRVQSSGREHTAHIELSAVPKWLRIVYAAASDEHALAFSADLPE